MTRRWLCPQCRTLLGVFRDRVLEIRYKAVTYVVKDAAAVEATCRRCGEVVKSA